MSNIYQARVAHLLREELAILIEQDLQDPALDTVQVRGIQVTRDRKHARVYVSHDDADVDRTAVLQALHRALGYCRRELAARNVLRKVPELQFVYSDAEKAAARVHALLDALELDAHDS